MTWLLVLVGAAAVATRLRPTPPSRLHCNAALPAEPRRRRGSARSREPDWARFLDRVAADVRGGSSLRRAVHLAATGLGFPPELLDTPTDAVSGPDRAVVLQSLAVAAQLGGAVAATIQQAANLLRERAAVRAEAAVHSAQARLSARVLTAVPLVFSTWSATSDRMYRRALLSPVGALAASAGLACNAIGWLWMRRLVRQATA